MSPLNLRPDAIIHGLRAPAERLRAAESARKMMIICLPPPGPIFFSRLLFAKRCAPPLALRRAVSAIIVPHASLLKRRLLKCRPPGRVDGVVCCVRTDHRFSVKSRGEHLDVGVLARARVPPGRDAGDALCFQPIRGDCSLVCQGAGA